MANKAVGEAWDEIVRAVRKRLGDEVEPKEGGKGKGKTVEEVPRKEMTMDKATYDKGLSIRRAVLGMPMWTRRWRGPTRSTSRCRISSPNIAGAPSGAARGCRGATAA